MKKSMLTAFFLATSLFLSNQYVLTTAYQKSTCHLDGMAGTQPPDTCQLRDFLKELRMTGIRKHGHNIILFVGKSGAGKTMGTEKMALEAGVKFRKYSAKKIIELFNSRGARVLREIVFKDVQDNKEPIVILIDKLDEICENGPDSHLTFITTLNSCLDNTLKHDHVIVIITARNPKILNKALLHRCVALNWELPDAEERENIFEFYLKDAPKNLSKEYLKTAASKTNRFSAFDIMKTIAYAKHLAEMEKAEKILDEHINKAIKEKRPMVDEKNPNATTKILKAGGAIAGGGYTVYRVYRWFNE